jgi:hypothetical protein
MIHNLTYCLKSETFDSAKIKWDSFRIIQNDKLAFLSSLSNNNNMLTVNGVKFNMDAQLLTKLCWMIMPSEYIPLNKNVQIFVTKNIGGHIRSIDIIDKFKYGSLTVNTHLYMTLLLKSLDIITLSNNEKSNISLYFDKIDKIFSC